MRFLRCTANGADRGSGQTACSGIAATTLRRFVVGCGRAISSRGSRCVDCAREWVRSLAVGRGADVCVAQSVPTLARPLRQAGRHPRGVPLARVRPDLLAIAGQDMENRLRPMPSFSGVHRRGRCVSEEIKLCGLLGGGSRWQALDIGKRNGVTRYLAPVGWAVGIRTRSETLVSIGKVRAFWSKRFSHRDSSLRFVHWRPARSSALCPVETFWRRT